MYNYKQQEMWPQWIKLCDHTRKNQAATIRKLSMLRYTYISYRGLFNYTVSNTQSN
jgi:hypothetical protein